MRLARRKRGGRLTRSKRVGGGGGAPAGLSVIGYSLDGLTGNTHDFTYPADIEAGDIMWIATIGTSAANPMSITSPTGWATDNDWQAHSSSSSYRVGLFYKTAVGTESGSFALAGTNIGLGGGALFVTRGGTFAQSGFSYARSTSFVAVSDQSLISVSLHNGSGTWTTKPGSIWESPSSQQGSMAIDEGTVESGNTATSTTYVTTSTNSIKGTLMIGFTV